MTRAADGGLLGSVARGLLPRDIVDVDASKLGALIRARNFFVDLVMTGSDSTSDVEIMFNLSRKHRNDPVLFAKVGSQGLTMSHASQILDFGVMENGDDDGAGASGDGGVNESDHDGNGDHNQLSNAEEDGNGESDPVISDDDREDASNRIKRKAVNYGGMGRGRKAAIVKKQKVVDVHDQGKMLIDIAGDVKDISFNDAGLLLFQNISSRGSGFFLVEIK